MKKLLLAGSIAGVVASFLAIFVFLTGKTDVPSMFKTENEIGNATVSLRRSKYTNLVRLKKNASLASYHPENSYLENDTGLLIEYQDIISQEITRGYSGENLNPHIANGELIIDFSVSSSKGRFVVDSINLVLDEVIPISDIEALGVVKPILSPVEEAVTIRRNKKSYSLYDGSIFSYADGDIDLFKLNVLIDDNEIPGIYKFKICTKYSLEKATNTACSEPVFLAKSNKGSTLRIPKEKRSNAIPKQATSTREIKKRIDSEFNRRGDYYDNGFYHEFWETLIGAQEYTDEVSEDSLISSYRDVFIRKNNSNDSPVSFARGAQMDLGPIASRNNELRPVIGDNWIIQQLEFEDGYTKYLAANSKNFLLLYGWNTTSKYQELVSATKKLALIGSVDSQLFPPNLKL